MAVRVNTTGNTRKALEADPMEAMTVDALIAGREGILHLYGLTPKGPFRAIFIDHADREHRGEGRKLSAAVKQAVL